MHLCKSIFAAIIALALFTFHQPQTLGDVLAAWEFSGLTNGGPSPYAPGSSNPGVSVGGLTRGSGVGVGGASNAWGGTHFATNTLTDAVTAADFLTFSFTAASDFMSFDSIGEYRTIRSSNGPSTGQWQYQLGGGSFNDIGANVNWGTGGSGTGGLNQSSISLSGISSLQNVAAGTTVTFRLVSWSGTTSGTWYLQDRTAVGNDLVINGALSAVPEASAFLYGGLISLGLCGWKWRQNRLRDDARA